MLWNVLDTGIATAQQNMAIDQDLLQNIKHGDAGILHFYDWAGDSATHGYFIDPYTYLNQQAVHDKKLNLARRPTGGGIIFHLFDMAFSFLIPVGHPGFSVNTLDNYAYVNNIVGEAVYCFSKGLANPVLQTSEFQPLDNSSSNFCMANPTKYDVMVNGLKVGGGAQRRTKQGYLHQGSVSLAMPSREYLQDILLSETCVYESMCKHSYLLLGLSSSPKQLKEAKVELRQFLIEASASQDLR